jgi:hypothetical protein
MSERKMLTEYVVYEKRFYGESFQKCVEEVLDATPKEHHEALMIEAESDEGTPYVNVFYQYQETAEQAAEREAKERAQSEASDRWMRVREIATLRALRAKYPDA